MLVIRCDGVSELMSLFIRSHMIELPKQLQKVRPGDKEGNVSEEDESSTGRESGLQTLEVHREGCGRKSLWRHGDSSLSILWLQRGILKGVKNTTY